MEKLKWYGVVFIMDEVALLERVAEGGMETKTEIMNDTELK